jgi:hypothetical protein
MDFLRGCGADEDIQVSKKTEKAVGGEETTKRININMSTIN